MASVGEQAEHGIIPHTMPTNGTRPEMQKIEQDYRRNVAIVEARPKLEQVAIFAWLLLDVALIVYFFFTVVLYLVSGAFAETRSVASIGANAGVSHDAAASRVAQPLLTGDAAVLTRDTGAYDIYATVENVNTDWYAEVTYAFQDGDAVTDEASAVILPGETHYLTSLNYAAATRPSGMELVVKDVHWVRVDRHVIEDVAAFLVDHGNIVADSTYAADVTYENDVVGRSELTLTNATPYAYYAPEFVVLLKRGGTIVGINTVTVPRFEAGSTRDVDVHWFGSIPTSSTVEVIPAINYFDEDAYMDPQGEPAADRRDAGEE